MQKHLVKKIVTDSCIEHYTLFFQKELYTYENLCGAYNIIGVDIKYMNVLIDFNSPVLIVYVPQEKSLRRELSKFGVLKVVKDIRHPDTTDPSSKGDFNLGMPNHLLYMAGYNKLAKKYNIGKPNPIVKEIIMRGLGVDDPSDVLFVGDTLYTDIQLAEESGFKSCLVLTGNSNRETLKNFVVEPDYVLNNVGELQSVLR